MTTHHHCECQHDRMAYCKNCDSAYCMDCKKEWKYQPTQYWYNTWTWKPFGTYTVPCGSSTTISQSNVGGGIDIPKCAHN